MNKTIGLAGSSINLLCVIAFAISMLVEKNFGGYFSSIFIALSFVMMTAAFYQDCEPDCKAAGLTAVTFSGIYAVLVLLVYFAQITTVKYDGLNTQAMQVINYQQFGLFFNYDLLGYGLMALSTFFTGLTLKKDHKINAALKLLLLLHGLFFISCFFMPITRLISFSSSSNAHGAVIAMEFWCLYFGVIDLLSFLHFIKGLSH